MSDIFREVEEDVRRERLEKFWKAYGSYILVLLALALIGIGGFEFWQRQQAELRDKDAASFVAAQHLTDPRAAEAAFAALAKTGHGGYGVMARLEQANVMVSTGQRPEAITLYKQIAEDDHGAIGSVARLRGAWAMADTAPRADLQSLLQPLLDPANVWRQMAQEILAYSDYRAGKTLLASGEFAKLAADPESPDALKSRARAFTAFLTSGGAAEYGTVPPPDPVPTPGAPGVPGAVATPDAATP